MSKLGKKPISIPKDTKVKVESGKLLLTGPKGSKELTINDKIFSATLADNNFLNIKLIKTNEKTKMLWGTTRSVINSALIGVSKGHEKTLELSGVGFRANLKGNIGVDKELVGKISSEIKMLKPVEPYKAKGIKEKNQYVLRKEGKKK